MDDFEIEPYTDEAAEIANEHSAPEVDLGRGPLSVEPVSGQEAEAPIAQPDISQAPIDQQEVNPQVPPTAGSNPLLDMYSQAFGQKKEALQDVAAAQAGAAQAQSKVFENQVNQQAQAQADYQAQHAQLDSEHKQLLNAVMQDKVDPNRLFSNMGTGNKILAAISVALSGLGSGLTGQPNMAMGVIQKAIDRDIEAQKMELGKKHTLLSDNLRRFGDLNIATQMTQLQMNAITQGKLAQIAAKSGSAQAIAQAKLLGADLTIQEAQLKQPILMRQSAMQGGNYDPATLVPYTVPKEHQKGVFEEISRAQDTRRMGDSILKSFDEAAKENTILKTGAGLLRTPPGVLALHQSMQPTFKDLEGTVRQAAMDNTFKNITPQPGDLPSTIRVKREALQDYLKSKASAPTAKAFGIDLDKFSSTTTDRPEIKSMGGVQYQKVPGGWKKI